MALAVLVTVPTRDAERLAKTLVEERVCACVNIVPKVKSFFWWKGKIDEAEESLLVIKTKESLFTVLKEMVKNNHPYELPEIIGFKIGEINKDYFDWLNKEASAPPFST